LDKEQFDKDKRKQKILQDSILLASLNQRIKEERCLWYAGSTTVSELYYDQRKYMLPKNEEHEIPNLQGFEYYKGGIFEVRTDSIQSRTTVTSNYVDEFDWRNRHGRNWMTPPKEQDCNHCWVFCPVSVAESSVNLYFNQSIDYDLSEQHVASCSGGNNGICFDGNISTSVAFIANQGVVVESCFPYMGQDPPNIPCGNVCSNPLETVSFNNYSLIQKSVDNIKKAVIENGPVCGGLFSLHHFMSIIGFKTLKEGDNVYSGEQYPLTNMTIQPNSPYIGQTCWLFKNSMGTNWGDGGYAYIFTQDINNL
jgi:Pyruvate/2-oxoacid:ferredoxin oxidoreductase delta subunit